MKDCSKKKENLNETTNVIYVCRVCGKRYDTIKEANICEAECLDKEEMEKNAKDIEQKIKENCVKVEAIKNQIEELEKQLNHLDTELDKLEQEGCNLVFQKQNLQKKENYILNGKSVSKDDFNKEIDKIFDNIFRM